MKRRGQRDGATPPWGSALSRLWTAAAFSNLADGLGRTAVPLIATTLTRDPLVIAALGAVAFLPWLLFGLPAGMIVDRFDRRYIMAFANTLRGAVALALAIFAATGTLTVVSLLVATLIFGLGETLFDNATNAIVPAVTPPKALDRANGFMQAAQITIDSFLAAPIAGILFAVSLALPLWLGAAAFIVPVLLAVFLPLSAARPLVAEHDAAPTKTGAGEALRYLWDTRYLRTMTLYTTVVGSSLAFAQAATFLYFLDEQHVPEAAIGFVMSGVGVGALVGSIVSPRLVARFGRGAVMFWTNIACVVCMAGVWIAPEIITAVISYAAFAACISIWNVPWGALRQTIIPNRLFGRVLGIIRSVTWGVMPIATLIGGLVAREDLRLPLIIGAGVQLVATLAWSRVILRASDYNEPIPAPRRESVSSMAA